MSTDFEYCQQKVAPFGSTLYYCLRFSPARARPGLTALLALKRELDEVVEECTELRVAEHKLSFWTESLQQLVATSGDGDLGNGSGRGVHPVIRALRELVSTRDLSSQDLTSILAATHDRLRTPQILSELELMQICQMTAGPFARIGLRHVQSCSLATSDSANITPWSAGDETRARDAGALLERIRLLWPAQRAGLPPHSSIPRELLVEHEVDRAALDRGQNGAGIEAMMSQIIVQLLRAIEQSIAALEADPNLRQSSGFLRGQLYIAQRELERTRRQMRIRVTALLPLEKLWLAWRHR